ncbi:M23 family metallopeptidase [Desulfovibrio sp. QI0430]
MSKFLSRLAPAALCIALGCPPTELVAGGASVAPAAASAKLATELATELVAEPSAGQPDSPESEAGQTEAQGTSASSQRAEPESSPAIPESAHPKTAANAEVCRSLPPLRELITSPFGNRRMPGWLSRRGMVMRDHGGIDIRAHMGWPVTAFKPGTVIRAGENGPLGLSVDIRQEDGMTARYGHMSKTLVKTGQRVTAGEPVGLVGCTGRTTGAHLHFGLLDASGKAVDPLPYLHSADEVLRPDPASIPPVIEAQSCGPVLRGPNGRPTRMGTTLKDLDNYTPPPIPTWDQRR